jgi:hypothetical protein
VSAARRALGVKNGAQAVPEARRVQIAAKERRDDFVGGDSAYEPHRE